MKLRESELQTERRVAAEAPVGGFAQKLPFKTLLANDQLWSNEEGQCGRARDGCFSCSIV